MTPGHPDCMGTPLVFLTGSFHVCYEKTFLHPSESVLSVQTGANPSTASQIKLFDMEKINIQSTLAEFFSCKSHSFLYVIKELSTNGFLPRVPKAVVKDMIKSPGLYHINYRIYTNKEGYESIYIAKAAKVVTK